MELWVLKVEGDAGKLLSLEEIKRAGASIREDLGDGKFVVLYADKSLVDKLVEEGYVSIPENEEELRRRIKEEEESASMGVGNLV